MMDDEERFPSFEEYVERAGLNEDPDVVRIDYLAAKAAWEMRQHERRTAAGTPESEPAVASEEEDAEAALSDEPPRRRWWWPL